MSSSMTWVGEWGIESLGFSKEGRRWRMGGRETEWRSRKGYTTAAKYETAASKASIDVCER